MGLQGMTAPSAGGTALGAPWQQDTITQEGILKTTDHESTAAASVKAFDAAAACLRVLAHPTRLRMVELLIQKEVSVGELASACGVLPHVASDHLRILSDKGLLERERRGRRIYYQILNPGLFDMMECIRSTFSTGPIAGRGPSNGGAG